MATPSSTSSLFALAGACLASRCSPDARIRHGAIEKYPRSLRLPSSVEDVIEATRKRFKLVVKDIGDYGPRRSYTFQMGVRTPEEEKELSWLEGRFGPEMRMERKRPMFRNEAAGVPPFEPDVRRRTLGECLLAAVEAFETGEIEDWILRWLCVDMGYNLDWLFFGIGPMCADWEADGAAMRGVPEPMSSFDQKTGKVSYEDSGALRDRQNMSLWNFTEWQWLFNLRAVIKTVYKPPTIPLLSRLVAGFRIPSQLPQMPNLLAWVDWLAVWCIHEFVEGRPAPGWKQDLVEQMATSRNTCLLLLGIGPNACAQYRSGRTEPTTCALRLAWMVRMCIERNGRDGFLEYLDVVDSEAAARGLVSLSKVFQTRSWSPTERQRVDVVPGALEVSVKEAEERNLPWGVPAEADLSPLELLTRIRKGSVRADPDAGLSWIPRDASPARDTISYNPDAALPSDED